MVGNTSVINNCDTMDRSRQHLTVHQETRMCGSGGSNGGETSNGNPAVVGVSSTISGRGTRRKNSVGQKGSHDARGSALNSSTTSQSLTLLFECPVCYEPVLPPIIQCQAGHLVCNTCRPKLNCCPTCRAPLKNIRNSALEKVFLTVSFPCKYSPSGCSVSLLHPDNISHEKLCDYQPYACPCPGASCKWQGYLVMEHLKNAHKSITTLPGEDIIFIATDISCTTAMNWVMIQSCFGYHFMLVLEKQHTYAGNQEFFAIVQFIGNQKQCKNFAYKVELKTSERRLVWEGTPRSILEGVSTAISKYDCLSLNGKTVQHFEDHDALAFNVTIKKKLAATQ